MPSAEILHLPVGETSHFGDTSIEVTSSLLSETHTPTDTARHEATHAVVALLNGTGVKNASVIPGPGYLGITELTGFDPVAAAAPHAMGHDGTGWDMMLVEAMGHDAGSAANVARNFAEKNQEIIQEVASHLDNNGSLSGNRINDIVQDLQKGEKVKVTIHDAITGETTTEELRATDGILMFPRREYDPAA